MKKRTITIGYRISIFFFLLIGAGLLYFMIQPWLLKKKTLPVLGVPGHTVLPFTLMDQAGDSVSDRDVEGKIRIAGFFFTTCKGICRVMNRNLMEINKEFSDDTDVVILSHTVDPAYDSVPILRNYARSMGALTGKWYFMTGTKQLLYRLASKSYLLNTDSISNVPVDTSFFHSPNVTLVDKQGRIRGFYDATDTKDISKLVVDIRRLR